MVRQYRFFSLPDGSIQFPMRGLPPAEVPGYEPDPGDPYLFHPVLEACTARIFVTLNDASCCPSGRRVKHCTKYGFYSMTPDTCKSCHDQGNDMPIELGMEKLQK